MAEYLTGFSADPDGATDPPDILVWLLRVEQWGLPNPGGFVQQPYHFMTEIEAAQAGRDRYRREADEATRANTSLQSSYEARMQETTDGNTAVAGQEIDLMSLVWPDAEAAI